MAVVDRLKIGLDTPVWFTMQATYNRELKVKKYLDDIGVKSFIPMCYRVDEQGRSKRLTLSPAISNLIFIYSSVNTIKQLKLKFPYLQYKLSLQSGQYVPTVVPLKQMLDFLALYESIDLSKISYLNPDDPSLARAKKVKIHCKGGALDGVEGHLVKIEGKRNRQLSISIDQRIIIAAAVDIDLVEIID